MILSAEVEEKIKGWLDKELKIYGLSSKALIRIILVVLENNQDSFESLREKLSSKLGEFFTHGMDDFIQNLWIFWKKVRRDNETTQNSSDSDSYHKSRDYSRKRSSEFEERSYSKRKKMGDSEDEDEQAHRSSHQRRDRNRYSGRSDYNMNRRNRDNQNDKKRDKNNRQFSKSSRYNNGDNIDDHQDSNRNSRNNNDYKFKKQFKNASNLCWINVTNIPKENFSISSLDEYFKRFGQINQVRLNTGTGSAYIQFNDPLSAKRAYKSPEAVFGNRFIKLFLVKEENPPVDNINNNNNNNNNNIPNNNQYNQHYNANYISNAPTVPPSIPPTAPYKYQKKVVHPPPTITPQPAKQAPVQATNKKALKELLLKLEESKNKLFAQQKEIYSMVEEGEKNNSLSEEEKQLLVNQYEDITNMLKSTMEKEAKILTTLNAELSAATPQPTSKLPAAADINALKKQQLDKELDRYQSSEPSSSSVNSNTTNLNVEENIDTPANPNLSLQETLNSLKKKAGQMGYNPFAQSSAYPHPRKPFNPLKSRPIPHSYSYKLAKPSKNPKFVLDNRTSTIIVRNIPDDILDQKITQLLNHFSSFGLISSYERKGSDLVIIYSTKKGAELATSGGSNFQSINLQIVWIKRNDNLISSTNEQQSNSSNTTDEITENNANETEEVSEIAYYDVNAGELEEGEFEESEERSFKR